MTGYEVLSAGEIGLLLVIEYVQTPEQLERGERKTIQTLLTPQQALELSESLRKSATMVSASESEPTAI